ncbi:carbonic anhydrase 2-like isoform X1 [Ostrea edulis]|uniref:carbonic anhydrase 2-like isoform X1 n=1 Tax=Ostrea edulis TaxID=37623 RepID=UPI0024AF238D|nr:carbonic anhydrase 2-like isoform X1 [Ostrea edulis]
MAVLVSVLIHTVLLAAGAVASDWQYSGSHGAYDWAKDFQNCGSVRQSPIDFPKAEDMVYNSSLKPIEFIGFDDPSKYTLKLENNGHTVKVKVEGGDLHVSGGGLPGKFKPAQFHFHWGHSDNEGSEHTYDGHRFPMELHIVSYNEKYGSLQNAAPKDGDGLAVLGFWYQISDHDNYAIAPLISQLSKVPTKGSSIQLPNTFNLGLLLPIHMDQHNPHFYRYPGSLTTPPCFQSVIWTVFDDKIPISSAQLQMFRALHEDKEKEGTHFLQDNYRPAQSLNDRTVYRNFEITPKTQQTGKRNAHVNVFLHMN